MEEVFDRMKAIASLASEMANFHMRFSKHPPMGYSEDRFGKVMMCKYNIHDTINALAYYLSRKKENHQGARYLLICGVFQALYIQQDAVSFLKDVLLSKNGKEEINWNEEYPSVGRIRNLRNRYFGHPTEGKEKYKFHVGAFQPTSNSLIEVKLAMARKVEDVQSALGLEDVNIHDAIKEQTIVIFDIMESIWTAMNEKLANTAQS